KLTRVDESLSEMFGDISAQLDSLTDTISGMGNKISDSITGLLS
ncbi:phage tail protein, partial [Morganella morganii subsp. morganii]|nr:phage tail protein [Morganella morganii subsp. morganii]MBT0502921.1 phage tail protein [Morganella morganii subsp. morganii]